MPPFQAFVRQFLHFLLPVDCATCGTALSDDPVPFFCRPCWGTIRPLKAPFCPRCGRPFESPTALRYSPTHLCGNCQRRRPSYTKAQSLYPYDGSLQDAIRLFKYRSKVALADNLAQLMIQARPQLKSVDVVMPVPLHPARLQERGYNQSLLLARRISRHHALPLSYDNLRRTRETRPQAELTRAERHKSLRRCFALRAPALVAEKRILLVDDVFTTGTTVNECAKALRRAGSSDVYVLTLARTL